MALLRTKAPCIRRAMFPKKKAQPVLLKTQVGQNTVENVGIALLRVQNHRVFTIGDDQFCIWADR